MVVRVADCYVSLLIFILVSILITPGSIASTSGGQLFFGLSWSPDDRYLAFRYSTVLCDDCDAASAQWTGLYDDVRQAYWGIHEGYTVVAEDLGMVFVVNSLGFYSVPRGGGDWKKHGRISTLSCHVTMNYAPDLQRLFLSDPWPRIYQLPEFQIIHEVRVGSSAWLGDGKKAYIPKPDSIDRRLQIIDRSTGTVEFHDLDLSQLGRELRLDHVPNTPILIISRVRSDQLLSYHFKRREQVTTIQSEDLEITTRNSDRITQFRGGTILSDKDYKCIYIFRNSPFLKFIPIGQAHQEEEFFVQIGDRIERYRLGVGWVEILYKNNAPENWKDHLGIQVNDFNVEQENHAFYRDTP